MANRLARFLPALDASTVRARRLEVDVRRPPRIGARVPAFVIRIALGALCIAMVAVQVPGAFWITIGVLLAVLGGAYPRSHASWIVILLLGLSRALGPAGAPEWRLLVLIAGLHAIAVLGSLAIALPGGVVQLRVFGRAALRYAAIQVVVQALTIAGYPLLSPTRAHVGGVPALAVLGACAFVALVAVAVAPLLRERPRG
jgi:hypothetical protein